MLLPGYPHLAVYISFFMDYVYIKRVSPGSQRAL